ncbi:MAG: nucleotide pyrophosphohydrolase [Pseudomonadota bacterium]
MTTNTPEAELAVAVSLGAFSAEVEAFVQARDWKQFHTPKNLAMALAGECGEVIEHFQWLTPESSAALDATTRQEVSHELADVLIYTLMLARSIDVDLLAAAREKLAINEQRYPAHLARGSARRAHAYVEPATGTGALVDPSSQDHHE